MNFLPVIKSDTKKTLLGLINKKLDELSRLKEKLEDFKRRLAAVHLEYVSRIGILYLKLSRVELEIKRYEKIINLMSQGFSFEEALTKCREKLKKEEEKIRADFNEIEEEIEFEDKLSKIPRENISQLKKLLRDLVKRFHPDLAENIEDKKKREKIMREINRAYGSADLEALEKIAADANIKNYFPDSNDALIKKIKVLENTIFLLKKEISDLSRLDIYKWKIRVERAKEKNIDLYRQLENELMQKILSKETHLEEVKMSNNLI